MTTPSAGTPTSLTSTITTPAATSTPKSTNPQTAPSTIAGGPVDRDQIYQWILELSSPETRETALLELSKKREVVPDLAPMLWNSFGTIAALLQEIIAIYPAINPPALTAHQSNRVCNPGSSLLPQAPVLYFSKWLLYHVLSLMIRYILQVKNRQNERICSLNVNKFSRFFFFIF